MERHARPRHAARSRRRRTRRVDTLCALTASRCSCVSRGPDRRASFEGDAFAISIASASLLTAMVTARRIDETRDIDAELRRLLSRGADHERGRSRQARRSGRARRNASVSLTDTVRHSCPGRSHARPVERLSSSHVRICASFRAENIRTSRARRAACRRSPAVSPCLRESLRA